METVIEVIKKYTKEPNSPTLKKPLELNELLELKEVLEQLGNKVIEVNFRGSGCYLKEVKERLRKDFAFDFSKFKIEKPAEAIAYNEPVFTPNETEADIEISWDCDQDKEDYWEFEEYNKREREKEKEIMESWKWETQEIETQLAQILQINKNK